VLANVELTLAEWLLFLPEVRDMSDTFQGVFIPLDCEFLVALWRKGGTANLKEVYHISKASSLEQHSVGNWSLKQGLQWRTVGFYRRRKNLRGLQLRVVVSEVRTACIHTKLSSNEGWNNMNLRKITTTLR
jgi:hypothetical protein